VPFMEARTARAPGLSALDVAEWTVRHDDFGAQMRRRREVLAEYSEIALGALGHAEPAELELLSMLTTHLGDGPRPLTLKERFCPLTAMGNLVCEDFCLLLPDAASGEYILVGAVLCFPSRWRLQEKLGRPLTIIHDPVPDYAEALSKRVNRVFEALRPDRPLVRINWTIHPTPELFLPLRLSEKQEHAFGATGPFYLRTERQTLVKLPKTGAIAFGIKTSISPVARLLPAEAARLLEILGTHRPDEIDYRGGPERHAGVLEELTAVAAQPADS